MAKNFIHIQSMDQDTLIDITQPHYLAFIALCPEISHFIVQTVTSLQEERCDGASDIKPPLHHVFFAPAIAAWEAAAAAAASSAAW
jgi:hypothetical protein